jgi:hypothetical protein
VSTTHAIDDRSTGNVSQFRSSQLLEPLIQAAVNQQPPAVDLEQVLRAGHPPRRPEHLQAHHGAPVTRTGVGGVFGNRPPIE